MTATLILPSKSDCPHKVAVLRLSLCAGVLGHPLTLSCKTRLYLYLQHDLVRYLPLSPLGLCSRWPHPLAKALGTSVRTASTVKVLTMLVWTITLQVLHYVSVYRWYLTFIKASPQLEELLLTVSNKPGKCLPERRRRLRHQALAKRMSKTETSNFYFLDQTYWSSP